MPENAHFFGFSTPLIGDTAHIDLNAPKIDRIVFSSGATIGSTRPHPLIHQTSTEKAVNYAAKFMSQANGQNYEAYLVGYENEKKEIEVGLDVLERGYRLTLHSLDLICSRL